MSEAASAVRPDGIQRGRGGFLRNAADAPYITDPDGATVKSGSRKGEPKRLVYASTSNFGTLIENRGSLEKWSERKVVEGIALGKFDELFTAWFDAAEGFPRNSIADQIVAKAKDVANSSLAADRGTFAHKITEHNDRGENWEQFMADGEALGITREQQVALCKAWQTMLLRHELEVLAIEASVVDDTWRTAGTLDRIVRLGSDLMFAGGIKIPAGTVLVLDLKTGSLRLTAAIQIASYAQSVAYDTELELRYQWPYTISQQHGLIAHMSIEDGTSELVHVDLVAGREHGGACVVKAKEWEKATPFAVAISKAEDVDGGPTEPAVAATPSTAVDSASTTVAPTATEEQTPETGDSRHPSPVLLTPGEQQNLVRSKGAPDEGPWVADGDFDALERHYRSLSRTARDWVNAIAAEAQRGGVSFHTKSNRTLRRYHLMRALVLIARDGDGETGTVDDFLRGLLEPIIGDAAHFAAIPVGHLIGSLSATEAEQFVGLLDGNYRIVITDESKPKARKTA